MKPRAHARKAIHDLTAAGWRPEEIASAMRMAERTVYRHLKALRRGAGQDGVVAEIRAYRDAREELGVELESA